jgi:hypothetical protein
MMSLNREFMAALLSLILSLIFTSGALASECFQLEAFLDQAPGKARTLTRVAGLDQLKTDAIRVQDRINDYASELPAEIYASVAQDSRFLEFQELFFDHRFLDRRLSTVFARFNTLQFKCQRLQINGLKFSINSLRSTDSLLVAEHRGRHQKISLKVSRVSPKELRFEFGFELKKTSCGFPSQFSLEISDVFLEGAPRTEGLKELDGAFRDAKSFLAKNRDEISNLCK